MPQFITPEMLILKESLCAHDITVPEVFQDYGDSVHRACWALSSKCKKCGDVFVYDTQFGVFGLSDDLKKRGYMYLKFEPNTKGTDYCVGDIHGCFDRLLDFLKGIDFDEKVDRLFCVGDLVDRGTNSDQVMDWLEQPWFHSVRGNHEQMVIDANDPYNSEAEGLLFMNGGQWFFKLDHTRQKEIAFAFESLPFMIEVETPNQVSFGIVHADVPWNDWNKAKERLYQEDVQVKNYLIWSRDRVNGYTQGDVVGVDYLVVGHTPLPEYQQENNVLRLDTGAVFKGKYAEYNNGLTLLNLHTLGVIYEFSN